MGFSKIHNALFEAYRIISIGLTEHGGDSKLEILKRRKLKIDSQNWINDYQDLIVVDTSKEMDSE